MAPNCSIVLYPLPKLFGFAISLRRSWFLVIATWANPDRNPKKTFQTRPRSVHPLIIHFFPFQTKSPSGIPDRESRSRPQKIFSKQYWSRSGIYIPDEVPIGYIPDRVYTRSGVLIGHFYSTQSPDQDLKIPFQTRPRSGIPYRCLVCTRSKKVNFLSN